MRNYELYHIGMPRRSGRYPWGSGERPYQSSGGKPGVFKRKKSKASQSKKPMTEEEKEQEKQRVLKTGSATEVLKYKGQLTNQQMQEAVTRLNLESQLKNLSSREIESNMQKVDKVMKGIKTGTDWVKIGTETYNALANIYNATPEGREKPLQIIGGGKKKDK